MIIKTKRSDILDIGFKHGPTCLWIAPFLYWLAIIPIIEGITTIIKRDVTIPMKSTSMAAPECNENKNGVIIGAMSVSKIKIDRQIAIFPEYIVAQIVPDTADGIDLRRIYPLTVLGLLGNTIVAPILATKGMRIYEAIA